MKTIIDLFNVLHMSFNVAKTQAEKEKGCFTEDDVGLYYHKVLDSIISIAKNHGQLIFANEGKNSLEWRRSIYPNYKANRKHDETYQIFKNHLDEILNLISYFPSKTISVDGAEADDVMYALATYFADNNEDVLVITSDRDIAQLINYSDKIKVYSPYTRTFREKQPNLILEKAIVGDPSDNITGIPRIGIKTFEKAMSNKDIWQTKIEPHKDLVENFVKIVDLSKAPAHLKEETIIQYNNIEFTQLDAASIEEFMYKHSLSEHLSRWNNDLGDINMALYEYDSTAVDAKAVETAKLDDVDDMLAFINNL